MAGIEKTMGLPDQEKPYQGIDHDAILQSQISRPTAWPSSLQFFWSSTSNTDRLLLTIATIAAMVGGAATPLSVLLLGNGSQSLRGFFSGDTTSQQLHSEITRLCLLYVYLALASLVAVYIATVGYTITGDRIAQRMREKYLAAVLRQNIAYFETLGVGEVNSQLTTDIYLIQEAITGKAAALVTALATCVSALLISFVKNWLLALIVLPAEILIVASMSTGAAVMIKHRLQAVAAYASAANISDEALSSTRTVTAFGMQRSLVQRYVAHIAAARVAGARSGVALACMIAALNSIIWWAYGLAFWQGSRFLVEDRVTVSAIVTVLFATISGAFALGNVSPHAQAFVNGIMAADKISQMIARQSPVDPSSDGGEKLPNVVGTLEFRHVRHIYPSRPDVLVLEDFSHVFPAGRTTAIVGHSGCGKSTIVDLLERLFLPLSGSIYLDGYDISKLNISWLRQQIGLVGQEATLFSTTIFENIRYGLVGSQFEHAAASEITTLVENAARTANAYDFIMMLPEGFDTSVGDSGSLLSGGQKQRIAIARAIVRNPKILILDEATSALDGNAERLVQEALQRASKGRTTIAVAHRLATIADADNILVLSKGAIVEQGTHRELLTRQLVYYQMIGNQSMRASNPCDPRLDSALAKPATLVQQQCIDSSLISEVSSDAGEKSSISGSVFGLARFVYLLNKTDLPLILCGMGFSVVAGASFPTQSVFMAKILASFALPESRYHEMREHVNYWCWFYVMIGFTTLLGWLGQGVCFAYYSQRLTYKAREQALDTVLHHDMRAFLKSDHSVSALSNVLASSASNLEGLSGAVCGTILVISTQLVSGFVLSLVVSWKFALVCSCTIPIQLACGTLRLKCLALLEARGRKVYASSAAYACEYSTNIRTVATLTLEKHIQRSYHDILELQRKKSLTATSYSAVLYAVSQSVTSLCASLAFWYGTKLVMTEGYTMFQFFVCYTAIVSGAFSAGAIFSFAPDIGKAKDAAKELKGLLDLPVGIDARKEIGLSLPVIDGSIQLRDVSFRYPNRPEQLVLDRVSMHIRSGQYVGLVGSSGSGKSTIVALLERFYDPVGGQIMVQGTDLRAWNVKNYRSHVALVDQMPALFDGSIYQNIALGMADEQVSEDAVVQACKEANIYDFVQSLPDGLSTTIGARGTMLSGGQKQRISIARALLRRPKILLLDEATSALDSESEKAVQAALDAAARGRTTIAVAHRLSTLQKADCIHVLDGGHIVESGTHQELIERRGKYYDMVQLQNFGQQS